MQDQEITHATKFAVDLIVITAHFRVEVGFAWKKREEASDCGLNQVNAGGFQRFHETAGQTDCQTVLVPGQFAFAGNKAQGSGFRLWFADEVVQQCLASCFVANKFIAVNNAIAGAVL